MPAKTPAPVAPRVYSYQRWSAKHQGRGDSLDRQTKLRDAWLAKHGHTLDESLVMTDAGVSAFKGAHRENPDRHALAGFLELVNRGRIPRGSYLILEDLSRLSREHIRPALTLLLNLIDAGVKVVQLLPVENVYDENVDPMNLMVAVMELSRGHSESKVKSERVGAAWRKRKARVAVDKSPVSKECPAWLEVVNGKYVVRAGADDAVRLIYKLAATGHGINGILAHLREKNVPPLGTCPAWARSTVAALLRSRKPVGEYQPRFWNGPGDRHPDGAPVPNFYPAVVSEAQWEAARYAVEGRKLKRGPVGKRVYLFSGLLFDARDGAKLYPIDKGEGFGGVKLVNAGVVEGRKVKGAKYVSFPLGAFEKSVIRELAELKLRDVRPGGDGGADEVETLTARRAALEARIERIQSKMVAGDEDVGPLVAVVRKLQADLDAVVRELADAEAKDATPVTDAWRDVQALTDALDGDDGVRQQLRAALRRLVASVHCLFVGIGHARLAAVRLHFRGGRHRDYLICHTPAHGVSKTPARTEVKSFADAGLGGGLDLRRRDHAARLEKALAAFAQKKS